MGSRWSNQRRELPDLCRSYVDQVLVPTLKPGDVVILDNLGSHKSKAVHLAHLANSFFRFARDLLG